MIGKRIEFIAFIIDWNGDLKESEPLCIWLGQQNLRMVRTYDNGVSIG